MALQWIDAVFPISRTTNGSTLHGTYTYRKRQWERSGLVRNPPSYIGWRNPSAYSAFYEDVQSVHSMDVSYTERAGIRQFTHSLVQQDYQELDSTRPYLNAISLTSGEENSVLARARNNVAGRVGSLSESVLELRSTSRGLAKNAETLNRFVTSVVKRDWRGALVSIGVNPNARKSRRATRRVIEAGGTFGSAWLNYSFGIKPIIGDMVTAAAYFSNEAVHRRLRVKGVAQGSFPRATQIITIPRPNGAQPYLYRKVTWTVHRKISYEIGCKYSLNFDIDSKGLALFTKYGGSDGAQALWAVVPWSFAVDWVLPISEVLRSNSATRGLRYKGGTKSIRKKAVMTQDSASFNVFDRNFVLHHAKTTEGRKTGLTLNRVVLPSQPFVSSLWIKDPFDMWKAGTSMALLFSNLKSALSR